MSSPSPQTGKTIREFLQDFTSPDYNRGIDPPQRQAGRTWSGVKIFNNTTHEDYKHTNLPPNIRPWIVARGETEAFDTVLDAVFDMQLVEILPARSLRYLMKDAYDIPFDREEVLVARLAATVFLELDRLLLYIHYYDMKFRTLNEGVDWYPRKLGYKPIFSEVRANASLSPSTRGGVFVPDRCAIADRTKALQVPHLLGDVKVSFKFQAEWRTLSRRDEGLTVTAARIPRPKASPGVEYRKVLAQVCHYMKGVSSGQDVPLGWAGKYGYIITDQEVVLIKREKVQGERELAVYATDGFPLRPDPVYTGWSGMMALVMIHFMASHTERFLVQYF